MTAGSGGLPALAFLASSFHGGTDVAAPLRQALAFLDTEACCTQAPAPRPPSPGPLVHTVFGKRSRIPRS